MYMCMVVCILHSLISQTPPFPPFPRNQGYTDLECELYNMHSAPVLMDYLSYVLAIAKAFILSCYLLENTCKNICGIE